MSGPYSTALLAGMSKQGSGKLMLVLGCLLTIGGCALLTLHHRVLATCFLDVVVTSIAPAGVPPIQSHDFFVGHDGVWADG